MIDPASPDSSSSTGNPRGSPNSRSSLIGGTPKEPFLKSGYRLLLSGDVRAICILLGVLVVGTYLPTLANGFVNYDDPDYVTGNVYVQRGLSWQGLRWAFSTLEGGFWHPITWISIMVDFQLFGSRAGGHHFTSLALHAINTALLFLFLRKATGATWGSAMVAALFGVHPLHVESVAWASERKDVLSTLFFMLCLLAYVKYAPRLSKSSPAYEPDLAARESKSQDSQPELRKRTVWYVLALLCFVLGLMSKTMLVTVPIILIMLDWWPLRRWRFETEKSILKQLPRTLLDKIPFFALGLIFGIVTIAAQAGSEALRSMVRLPLSHRVANVLLTYVHYLVQVFWPLRLAVYYPYPRAFSFAALGIATALLLAISVAAWKLAARRPYFAFGWAWYLVTLLPVIGLIQVGDQAQADRYTYIPLIGVFTVLVWGFQSCFAGGGQGMKVAILTGIGATIFCAALTYRQIHYWRDSAKLFSHALEVTKSNALAHNNLGTALAEKRRLDEAILHFEEAIRLKPEYFVAHNNLSGALLGRGRFDQAIRQAELAIALRSDYAGAHRNLGAALGSKGRLEEAIGQLREAIRLDPRDCEAHYNLGVAYVAKNRLDEAIAEFQEAVRLRPDHLNARNNLVAVKNLKSQMNKQPH